MKYETAYSDDPFNRPGAKKMTAWTLRLAEDAIFKSWLITDPHAFALFYAACAASVDPPESLTSEQTSSSVGGETKLLVTLKDLQRQFGDKTSGRFASLYLKGIALHPKVSEHGGMKDFKEWEENAKAEAAQTITSSETNIDFLSGLLRLNAVEKDILNFQVNRFKPGFMQLFDLLLAGNAAFSLSALLSTDYSSITSALSEDGVLVRSGLVTVQERPLRLFPASPYLLSTLIESATNEEEFFKRFVMPLEATPTTASLARLEVRDRAILLALLEIPIPEGHGVHILVYGPKTVDKHDMLARLLAEEGISVYAIKSKNVPTGNLPAWAFVAQSYLQKHHPGAVLVIDKAEQILTAHPENIFALLGMIGEDGSPEVEAEELVSDKGLTESRMRCLWLTSKANTLSERNLGRFLFHCEAKPGSRTDRRERITSVISEFALSKELESHMSKYTFLGENQLRQAATLAHLIGERKADREQIIRRAVSQSQRVLGREHTENLRDSVTKYSLANLNISGRFQAEQIIKSLRKRPAGSLCFYGLPGAGKTQLAEYIAVELDLPLLAKSASDLLSKWLGESEQNIAAMFAEAENEGALLFLDEADSFLRDRSLARAEWSVTQVNEILQKMERCPGIFIAATNLMRDIDAAALRRFTWKLEFLALKPAQAWKMFCTESGFRSKDLTRCKELKESLRAIDNLTPGDFATVKRQANMLGEELTPEQWLEQLAAEAKAKMLGLDRNKIGFA